MRSAGRSTAAPPPARSAAQEHSEGRYENAFGPDIPRQYFPSFPERLCDTARSPELRGSGHADNRNAPIPAIRSWWRLRAARPLLAAPSRPSRWT